MDRIDKEELDIDRIDINRIKGAIFDIDGTLLDSMSIWAELCSRYLQSKGITDIEKDIDEKVYYLTFEEGCRYIKTRYLVNESVSKIQFQISEMIRDFYYNDVWLKPGVFEFVELLSKKGIPLVLATTGDEDLSSHALNRLGIADRFSKLLTCGMLNTSKRDTLIFDRAKQVIEEFYENNIIENNVIENKDIYVFEDSLTAIKTCKKMGYSIVGIRDEYSKNDWREIESLSNICINSFVELM